MVTDETRRILAEVRREWWPDSRDVYAEFEDASGFNGEMSVHYRGGPIEIAQAIKRDPRRFLYCWNTPF